MRKPVLVLAALVLAAVFAFALGGCFLQPHRALLHPPRSEPPAPAVYTVTFTTTQGPFAIQVHRAWAPRGADRFYDLARHGFYNGCAFFRVIPTFVVQWGLSPDPRISAAWNNANLRDDPVVQSNTLGMVSFAMGGPNSRTTQVYINLGNNARLDKLGFAPFGRVVRGMSVIARFYSGYGEGAPRGHGPSQRLLQKQGAPYLEKNFPRLDRILATRVARG
jgi:peptidyl-prolyl cis-trans isomerase A (cyclophilin A)